MATTFKNVLINELGTTEIAVHSTGTLGRTTVIGMALTNLTNSIVLVNVKLEDTIAGVTAFYAKEVIVPPNQSLRLINGGEKLILGPSTNVKMSCNIDDAIDLVMSFVEIT